MKQDRQIWDAIEILSQAAAHNARSRKLQEMADVTGWTDATRARASAEAAMRASMLLSNTVTDILTGKKTI